MRLRLAAAAGDTIGATHPAERQDPCPDPTPNRAASSSSSRTTGPSPTSSGSTCAGRASGCTSRADGAAALDAVGRLHPVAVVLDIGLPGLDGVEVCRRMRAAGDWTPVLFVTARDDEVDRIVGLELGADDYVTKPFSPRELVARVRAVLRRAGGAPAARGGAGDGAGAACRSTAGGCTSTTARSR